MGDTKISALTNSTNTPADTDAFVTVEQMGGIPVTRRKPWSVIRPVPVEGYLYNGQIITSVTSNNLTVAIKTLAGNDPSATDQVVVRIGNTIRNITSALSVTKNAGTNWMNLGGAELATQDVDVFVYLGYNATDGITLGFARIPYARTYSDFSVTSNNEKYAAISTITNASASDVYEVVGRCNVTLGVSATYYWSIPGGTSIVINRPIYETRILLFAPTITYSGGATDPTSNTLLTRSYYINGHIFSFVIVSQLVVGIGNRTNTIYTLPFNAINFSFFPAMNTITAASPYKLAISLTTVGTPTTIAVIETMAANGYYWLAPTGTI